MCTAISDNQNGHFFARTLDVERSYGERLLGVGRNFPLHFLHEETENRHPFILGVGIVSDGYPLFFDAVNECGLAMAGLSFPESARYCCVQNGKTNVASFELIPFLLSKCESVGDARALLRNIVVTDDDFSHTFPATPLHWIIADKNECIVAEPLDDGLHVYENPFGVLTNEPPFPSQTDGLKEYCYSASESYTSRARFSRAQYVKSRALATPSSSFSSSSLASPSLDGVFRVFSLMATVRVPYACSSTPEGKPSYTVYTSCADTQNCAYYVEGESPFEVARVTMGECDANSSAIREIPFGQADRIM